jgi:Ca2+/Na+ antiporter
MIINSLRLLAVILLVIILIIKDIPFKSLFKDSMIQFYLALTCMIFLLLIDNIFGFILSICLLLLYFRIYTNELKNKKESSNADDKVPNKEHIHSHNSNEDKTNKPKSKSNETCETCETCVMNMSHINAEKKIAIPSQSSSQSNNSVNSTDNSLVPYITEENLLAAQNNIVNPLEYNKEMHGVDKGIYNEDVYGSQGLDTKNIHIRGYDTNNIYLGSLSYDIL